MMEERLIVLLARYTADGKIIEEARKIIAEGVDWYKVFLLALNNKIIGLVYYNLVRYKLLVKMKPIIYNLMKYYYFCNKERNKLILSEKKKIIDTLNNRGINVLSLKGGVLLEHVYQDIGSRVCNDLDFFCNLGDAKYFDEILGSIGYKQGEIDWNEQDIKDFSRIKKTGWKMNMNTIPTYIRKMPDNDFVDFLELDFSYAFDLRKDVSIVDLVFDRSINNEMDECDTIIYLCSHLFKEAENDIWIEAKADMNLIKFCDIRESMISFNKEGIDRLVGRALELNCAEAVNYCMYYLLLVYDENIFKEVIAAFLEKGYELKRTKFEELDYSEENAQRFWKRIFTYDNASLLLDEKYILNKKIIEQGDV